MLKDTISTSIEKTTMLASTQTDVSTEQRPSRPQRLSTKPIKITSIMTSSALSTMIRATDQTKNTTLTNTNEETTLFTSSHLTKIVRTTDQTTTEHPPISGK